MKRLFKQGIIAAIYFTIFGLTGWGIWNAMYPVSCTDGIQNGAETGVDCGGTCGSCELRTLGLPVTLRKVYFLGQNGNTIDTGVQIKNPNPNWGVESFSYRVDFKDAAGRIIPGSLYGSSFLMPGQTRWIMELGKFLPGTIADFNMTIATSTIMWEKLQPYVTESEFIVQNPILKKLVAPATGYAEITGTITNRSHFDARNLEIQGVVYDKNKSAIGIGNTIVTLLHQGETRDFRIFWARPFKGDDKSFDVFVNVNLMQDQNFLQKYQYPQ